MSLKKNVDLHQKNVYQLRKYFEFFSTKKYREIR